MKLWTLRQAHGVAAFALCTAVAVACGSGDSNDDASGAGGDPQVDGGSALPLGSDGGPGTFGTATVTSITIEPASAAIESVDGAPVTKAFSLVAHYADGSSGAIAMGAAWTAGLPQVGSIGADGTYAATGSVGGVVPITAAYKGLTAQGALTVKLHLHEGVAAAGPGAIAGLGGATVKDPGVAWAYPYDGTVFPRGLAAPPLMWNGGGASDVVRVHVTSPTFELESYAAAPAPDARFAFAPATWQRLVDSTSGKAQIVVARWDGAAATVLASHTWTIAPASMRGTIYYWAQNIGRVVRIKPGAALPDDFANAPPLSDKSQYPASSCLMTCHTVSANGQVIVSGGGSFGGAYSLKTSQPIHSLGNYVWGGGANGDVSNWQNIQWSNAALTPDGTYVVENQLASQLSIAAGGPALGGMFRTADGTAVANSGLPTDAVFMPAFSPDATKLVYVAGSAQFSGNWITSSAPGALRVMDFDAAKSPMLTGARDLVQPGTDPAYSDITWPTVAPDGKWALYARSNGTVIDSRGNCGGSGCDFTTRGDLYLADTTAPNGETRLAALNGDAYPFAAGARDLHYNYEPTFAPVAAGGYFWVVFTSRRTYGNKLAGGPGMSKQLWVAAIDQHPVPGQDPSHPAFHLGGQDEATLNLRGFWALDPCKGDGVGCASGTECCGGYCDASGDAGAPVCKSQATGCSGDGDKCQTNADCCGAAQGTTCINHVCSEGAPR